MPRLITFPKGSLADAVGLLQLNLHIPPVAFVVGPGQNEQCKRNLDKLYCKDEPDLHACRCKNRAKYLICGAPHPACP